MKLIASKIASRRTRNRIRENGPFFEDGKGLVQCVMVRGECGVPAADGWIGWLPIAEIERTTRGGVKFMWPLDEDGEFQSGGWVCLDHHAWIKEEQMDDLSFSGDHLKY